MLSDRGDIKWLSAEEVKNFPNAKLCMPYEFVPVKFSLNKKGVAEWEEAAPGEPTNIRIFRIKDYYLYNKAMFLFLKHQFSNNI